MEVDENESDEVIYMDKCRNDEEIVDRPENDHICAVVAQSPVR